MSSFRLDNFLLDDSDMVTVLLTTSTCSWGFTPLIIFSWFVQEVDDLLRCVCDAESVQEVQQFGSALLQHLQRAKQRRHDIVTQEMKAVMEERDAAIFKVGVVVSVV